MSEYMPESMSDRMSEYVYIQHYTTNKYLYYIYNYIFGITRKKYLAFFGAEPHMCNGTCHMSINCEILDAEIVFGGEIPMKSPPPLPSLGCSGPMAGSSWKWLSFRADATATWPSLSCLWKIVCTFWGRRGWLIRWVSKTLHWGIWWLTTGFSGNYRFLRQELGKHAKQSGTAK